MRFIESRRPGFTLIELLVVIAIIAILAAILFPVFEAAKERGRQTKCLYNLKQLGQAVRTYADEYDGRMPSAGTYLGTLVDWCGSSRVGKQVYPSKGQLWPYVKNEKLYLCPTDKRVMADQVGIRNYALSYSMNWKLHCLKIDSAMLRPSRVLLFIHEGRNTIDDGLFLWAPDYLHNNPSRIHYDGTTIAYADGHAIWASFDKLDAERKTNVWDPTGKSR